MPTIDTSDMTPDELAIFNGTAKDTPEPKPEPKAEAKPEAEKAGYVAGFSEDEATEATAETADAAPAEAEAEAAPAEPEAEAPAPEPAPEPEKPFAYEVADKDFPALKAELKAERKEIEKKWSAGELDDDQRAAQLEAIEDKLEALLVEQTRIATLKEANEQAARAAAAAQAKAEMTAMKALAEEQAAAVKAGKPGIDYKQDPKAAKQFDALFTAVKADPDNAGKSVKDMVADTHRALLALRGIQIAKPAPQREKPPAPPQTLSRIPAAAPQPVGDALDEELDSIEDPDEREARIAALPRAQREARLRNAYNSTSRR